MRVMILAITVVAGAWLVPGTARADGECRQAANDVFVAASTEGTRGDFMSDVIFGNEPNIEGPFGRAERTAARRTRR